MPQPASNDGEASGFSPGFAFTFRPFGCGRQPYDGLKVTDMVKRGPPRGRGRFAVPRGCGGARTLSRSREGLETEAQAVAAGFRLALRQLPVPGRTLVARDLRAVFHVHGPL